MDQVVLSVTAFGGAIFAAGLAFGGLIAYLILPGERRARRLQSELEEARKESAEYKARVSRHFHRTAELVSNMTHSYKAVYDHLAGGARELAEAPDGSHALAFAEARLLMDPAQGAAPAAGREGDERPVEEPQRATEGSEEPSSRSREGARAA